MVKPKMVMSKWSDLGRWVYLSVVLDQQFGNWDMVFLSCKVHRSQAVLSATVRVGAAGKQKFDHSHVSFLSSEMQGRESILEH